MILILLFMNRRDSIVALLIWSLSKTWRIKHYETSTSDIKRSRHEVFQQFSTWICCYQPPDPRPPGRCVWGRGREYLIRRIIMKKISKHKWKISKQNSHQIDMTIGEPFKLNLIRNLSRIWSFSLVKTTSDKRNLANNFSVMDMDSVDTTWSTSP